MTRDETSGGELTSQVASFRKEASTMEVEARSPSVTDTVSMRKVQDWLNGGAKSPSEKIIKDRLKGLMAS